MMSQVKFKGSKNQTLSGVAHIAEEGVGIPWVILCHGMFSSKAGKKVTEIAERCATVGLNALRFDFTGCGESEGERGGILYSQQAKDVSSAVDFLEERYKPARLCLVGSSMGAATAILHAARRPYKLSCVVLIAPPSDTLSYVKENFSAEQMKAWEKSGVWREGDQVVKYEFYDDAKRQNLIEAAKLLHLPTLVIHGKKDELVPVRCAEEIFEALPYTKGLILMEKADHQFTREEDRERVVSLTVGWCLAYVLSDFDPRRKPL